MKQNSYFVISLLLIASVCGYSAPESFENPPVLQANSVLPADMLKGANYTVDSKVENDGYTNIYTIDSTYGSFTAYGDSMLADRLQEIEAITQLKEVSSSEAFAKAAAKQAIKPIESAAKIVEDPVGTVKGIPGGIKRKFENVGRFVKKQKQEKPEEEADSETSAATQVTRDVLGVTAAHRKWAQKVGADPYTTNPVLQSELDRLAKVDSVASLGVKMAERKVPGVRPISRVYELAWGMDPQALQKMNEKRLTEMGVDEKLSQTFFQNKALTLTQQTMIVSALYELPKTENRSEWIRSAATAETERDAYLYTDSAHVISQMKAKGNPISRFVNNPRLIVLDSGKNLVGVLPADRIYWAKGFAQALNQFEKRHAADFKKGSVKQLWLSGETSGRFKKEMTARGWQITEKIYTQTP